MKRVKNKFLHSLIALIMCLFCSLSVVACVPGSSNPGKGSNLVPGGGTEGSKPTTFGPEETEPDLGGVVGDGPNISDYNTVFAGAVAVYETDQNTAIFYDKYQQKNMTFKELIDRQFDTMVDYLYNTLNKIYGTTIASNTGAISGFKSSVVNYNYSDTISTANQKKIAGLDTGTLANKETLNYTDAINGGYKIAYKEVTETDEGTGETVTSYAFDAYSTTEKVTTNAWKGASRFTKDYLKQALMDMYITYEGISTDASVDFNYTAAPLLKTKYTTYSPTYTVSNAYSEIRKLGLTEKYLWNVAYFLAYDIIGETNLNNSINGAEEIFSGSNIKPLTGITAENLAIFETYQNYKGYDVIIEELVWNMAKLAVPSSGTISFASSVKYFEGTNSSTTMFPRVQQYEYIFYDNIDNIADVKPSPEPDPDEEYDPDAETEPTLEGTARRLKELIYIPYITTDEVEDTFAVDTLFVGLKKASGSDFSIKITFDAIYNDSSKKATDKSITFSTDYENVSSGRVVVSSTYDDMEHTLDGSMYTESELEDIENYSFGNAVLKNGVSVDSFISNSFNKENYTIKYSDNTTNTYEIARMCVYNDLFDSTLNLNFSKNYLRFNFDYYTKEGTTLDSIPSMYLMYLTVESM